MKDLQIRKQTLESRWWQEEEGLLRAASKYAKEPEKFIEYIKMNKKLWLIYY